MPLTNQKVLDHEFLNNMYHDGYFPHHLVDKGKAVLLKLCERIETENPTDLAALYRLTHAATEEFNDLEEEFEAADSELETVARETIGEDFWHIATFYGFSEADPEEMIAPRNW